MNSFRKIFVLTLFALPFVAGAHATPVSYAPLPGESLGKAPTAVVLRFNEHIEAAASSVRVLDSKGVRVDQNQVSLDSDAITLRAPLSVATDGVYAVAWQVVSRDDGHFTKGAYSFSVGSTSSALPGATLPELDQGVNSAEGVATGVELSGAALLVGFLLFNMFAWKKKLWSETLSSRYKKRMFASFTLATALVVGGSVFFLVTKASNLVTVELGFHGALLLFAHTAAGEGALVRLVCALLFFGLVFLFRDSFFGKGKGAALDLVLCALLLISTWSRARVSHAAASHFYPGFSVFVNFVHLLSKDLWVGGVLAFVLVFVPIFRSDEDRSFLFSFFERVTLLSFFVGGVTGVYIIWLHLKSFENIFTTTWGIGFVLLSLGAFFLVLFRLLGAFDFAKRDFFLKMEALAAVFVILATGFLVITTPPISTAGRYDATVSDHGVSFRLRQDPLSDQSLLFVVDGAQFQDRDVVLTAENKDADIGPLDVALATTSTQGVYAIPVATLVPGGAWSFLATLLRPGEYDSHGRFVFDTRTELLPLGVEHRTLGFFEWVMIAAALGIALTAFAIWKRL